MTISKRFALQVSALLILLPLAMGQKYSIIDLGTFPGGGVSEGQAVNINGEVAGYARFADYNAHGFLWTQGAGLVDLGAIPPESNFSLAEAINSFGEIVGYSDYNEIENSHAVAWDHGKLRDLGTLPGGTVSQANGVDDAGEIAGFSNGTNVAVHATLWNRQGTIQDLGALAGGYSQGIAINIGGEVVGYSLAGDGAYRGFLWTRKTGLRALPMLSSTDSDASANGINEFGEIVGGSGSYAVLWRNDQHHTPQNLGVLPGQTWSTAFAINDVGQVVGWSGFVAFVWSEKEGIQNLNDLIPRHSGWQLSTANGINVLGQITGQGTINGEQHAFLLTPLE